MKKRKNWDRYDEYVLLATSWPYYHGKLNRKRKYTNKVSSDKGETKSYWNKWFRRNGKKESNDSVIY